MGIVDVIETTLRVLEMIEVRGKNNRRALDVAVSNLEAIVEAFGKAKEEQGHDGDDQPGQDV